MNFIGPQRQVQVHLGEIFMDRTECGAAFTVNHYLFGVAVDDLRLTHREPLVVMNLDGIKMHNELAERSAFYPLITVCPTCKAAQDKSIAEVQAVLEKIIKEEAQS